MVKITSDSSILNNKEFNFIDMHNHSNVSDGSKSPEFLAKYFAKKGIGLSITDHNEIKGAVHLSKKDIFSIPGIEITTKQTKDILVYFYDIKDLIAFYETEIKQHKIPNRFFKWHKTSIDTFDLLDKIKQYNGISALPHPLALKPKNSHLLLKNSEFVKKIDAIESHNFCINQYKKTMNLISKFKKPLTAGSDSHYVSLLNTLTGSHESNINDFLKSILKKQNVIYYQDNHFFSRQLERFMIIKNNITLTKK